MSEQEQEKPGKLKIDGKVYEFPTDFKVGELRILGRYTGNPIDQINWSDPEAIAAVVLILRRREDPAFSEEALDDCTITFDEEDEEESPPAVAAVPEPQPPTLPAASGVQS